MAGHCRVVLIENGLGAMAESQLVRPERMAADRGSTGSRKDHDGYNGDSLVIPISALTMSLLRTCSA